MDEIVQFVPLMNCWDSVVVPAVRFEPLSLGAASVPNLPAPNFVLAPLQPELLDLYLKQAQIDQAIPYVRQPSDERIVRNALASLNQLFACEPRQVIEAFVDYIFHSEPYVDGLRNRRQELVLSSAVSSTPRDRQVCAETAAKDHVIHLETITLAKEQEAPTATAVGQMLISGRELWKKWKRKLLNSFSRYSRNGSIVVYQIAFANAVQASSY